MRSLVAINGFLLSTAFAVPAMGQIEEVVVTAQKRTEDVQNVPIAVTAFTGQDLKTQQIQQFKDLQFHAPNLTYTEGSFGTADIQIRGIGITAVGYDAESGVGVNFDEVYLQAPQLYEASFYDLSGVEVLAGPQSTLYGRGASAGVVNVNIAKPQMDEAFAQLIGDYGNYNAWKVQGVINIPIVDNELAIRIAGDWDKRDGFVKNLFDNQNVDGLSQYSVRSTVRWTPTTRTTIDLTGEFSWEDDSHLRADKTLCDPDPSGVLGCLPNARATGTVNPNATLDQIFSSQQGFANTLGPALGPFSAFAPLLGLYNLQAPSIVPGNPSNLRQINTDFTPVWRSQDNFLSAKWQQNLTPWLDAVAILGYDHDQYFAQEGYTSYPSQPLPRNTGGTLAACGASAVGAPNLDCAENVFLTLMSAAGGPAYAANFAPYFAVPGELPISQIKGLGVTSGNYVFTPNNDAFDQSNDATSETSAEVRFTTSFAGPLNGMLGLYYLHSRNVGDYYVSTTTLTYPAIVLGGFLGLNDPTLCASTGCIVSPPYYHNADTETALTSKAMFGELYYDVIPDTFKLTGGLRFTEDQKFNTGRLLLLSGGPVPIGTPNENVFPTSPAPPANPLGDIPVSQTFDAYTGRVVANWTPKLDFTDQTLNYVSYATGYKAGGANPNIEPGIPGVPQKYNPENIIAYELGSKNTLLGGTLQANGDVYYYDYKGLQVYTSQDNTAVNDNVAAHMWGTEGSFIWQATDRLQFGLNAAHEESNIQNTSLVDPANPTGGNQQTLLVKDDTISATGGLNCVFYYSGAFPGLPAGYVAPAGGVHALAAYGIPNVAYGSCANVPAGFSAGNSALGQSTTGQAVSLNGHSLQNTPQLSLGGSAQYTQPLPSDYSLVARIDAHWQTHFWGTIFHDPSALINSEYIVNASLQFNPPDDVWYVQAYIRNITNQTNITGEGTASQTSGLFTAAYIGDPRTFGIEIGAKLE